MKNLPFWLLFFLVPVGGLFSFSLAAGGGEEEAQPAVAARGVWWDVEFRPNHSTLAPVPRWEELDMWQETMTRETFERLLREVYGGEGGGWEEFIEIGEERALVVREAADMEGKRFELRFADEDVAVPQRGWRSREELGLTRIFGDERALLRVWRVSIRVPLPRAPLDGLHVALDPGHLGGSWARLEHRYFRVGEGKPVVEGDMVLKVARILRDKLEAEGARVSMVRDSDEPLTRLRPDDLEAYARVWLAQRGVAGPDAEAVSRVARRIFVVNAEIRARAALINERLRPDVVICLHFNAEPWGDADGAVFSPHNHLHVLVHGCLLPEEWANDDERLDTLVRILQRTHEEEIPFAAVMADALAEATGLPPFTYRGPNARSVCESPFVWARNLLANRVFRAPVLFLEPHVMNHELTFERVQAGAYEGLREFEGVKRENIYLEYARAVAEAVREWYVGGGAGAGAEVWADYGSEDENRPAAGVNGSESG